MRHILWRLRRLFPHRRRPAWVAGVGVLLTLAALPVSLLLHRPVAAVCLGVAGVACAAFGDLRARRNEGGYRAARRLVDEDRGHRG